MQKLVGNVEIEYTGARPGDFGGKEVTSEKALEELGWAPRTKFEEGVRRYIQWYRDEERSRHERWELVDDYLKV